MTAKLEFEKLEEQNKLIWKSSNSTHTKAQKDFNDALAKHKLAIKQAELIDKLVEYANNEYAKQIYPEIENRKKLTALRTEMLRDIYLENLVRLSKHQKNSLKLCILEICSNEIEDNREFYFAIIIQLETTAERNQRLLEKKQIEQQLKNQYGFDVDLDELNNKNFKTEEEREAHQEKYKEFFDKFNHQHENDFENYFRAGNRKEKSKTKAQQEKEAKLAEVEKLLNTDINKLFKELAKLIHPDREQNPELREKKETLMKELSNARDNSDIADILRIKLLVDELLPNNTNEISLNDSSIKRFVTIIKTKIAELEKTIKQKSYSFPFEFTINPKNLNVEMIEKHIKVEQRSLNRENKDLEIEIDSLRDDPRFIKEVLEDFQLINNYKW